jgi:uncharacterized damage-inducible protein DinB
MDFLSQYELVKSSRGILLEFCKGISATDFITENSSFGRGSIRNLLVHIGNTYEFWIGKHALRRSPAIRPYDAVSSVDGVVSYFLDIDSLILAFIDKFHSNPLKLVDVLLSDKQITVTPLQLFTHVITHEFHHKGQILSLSRHLGYIPVDTDIIR